MPLRQSLNNLFIPNGYSIIIQRPQRHARLVRPTMIFHIQRRATVGAEAADGDTGWEGFDW